MDRISGLSDELLVKILLLVPTKVAVSTSILSKRWKYLWMWLPKLEFRNRHCSEPESERLQSFLDRNLPLHRAPVIESFRLELHSSHFKPENISMWVSTALSHCLRELDITRVSHSSAKPIVLPSNLYTCKSLVVLKLKGDILFDVPGMFSLPSLKTLVISVRYLSEETRQRLLSNCPILEDLVLGLRDGDTTGKLTLYFKLVDHSSNDHYCLIENMPCLIEAYLDCGSHDINIVIGSITSVKRLTICCSETMLDEGCVFNQLEHLEVCICKEHFSNQLFQLLKASSNLQGLCLYYMDGHHYEFIGHWNQPTTIPECISLSLQSFSWWNYTGIPEEREILVYILKHARHLKTATIKSSQSPRVPESEMLKELELSSRASAACQLMFE
ncbi:hypothetical protein Bca52824_000145 [Brassica carinata]|uniref:FBD domain-containing protein n=1 Tax=Brassica carinata TaxID=52824 RepID=A0A8X7WHL3_BRACI|nr:hypothetical protein Bca52824_000145 [Brassica carinata]